MSSSVDIYIEAACLGSQGVAGWGALILEGGEQRKLYGGAPESSHNRMHLTAAIAALEALEDSCEVRMYTESRYLCDNIASCIKDWEERGWRSTNSKPIQNADLWKQLKEASARHQVEWLWLPRRNENAIPERVGTVALAEQGLKENLPPGHDMQKS